MLSNFLMPMLRPEPEKRAKAEEMLKNPWLSMPDAVPKMSDDEYKMYLLKKEALSQNKEEDQPIVDSELEYADGEDNDDDYDNDEDFYEYKPTYDPKLIDRSFTNLGYIGFGDGIDLGALDNTGNWQFENL